MRAVGALVHARSLCTEPWLLILLWLADRTDNGGTSDVFTPVLCLAMTCVVHLGRTHYTGTKLSVYHLR